MSLEVNRFSFSVSAGSGEMPAGKWENGHRGTCEKVKG